MKKSIIAGVLCLALVFSLSGCKTKTQTADLMTGVKANALSTDIDLVGNNSTAIANFAVRLFQNSTSAAKNTLVSPISVLCDLAMTANGAKNETLSQMEDVFGLSVQVLNNYFHAYLKNLPSSDKYMVSTANSIWIKDDESLAVEKNFLQTNADYYGASIYKAAFDDTTLKDINKWVCDNTDGMIEKILNKISDDSTAYLINALAFDAEWENVYTEDQVRNGDFTTDSGETRNVEMMYGSENTYLNDGSATGFVKYYANKKYALAALLPNEGVSIDDYVISMTGEGLMNTLENAQDIEVNTAIPKFKSKYSVEMSNILKSMGMTNAFNSSLADFAGLGKSEAGNIFIGRVIHETNIAVDERGTKAGAVTAVEIDTACMPLEEPKTVYLNRPFVYMLIDCETNLPVFIGTEMDIG